MEQRYRGLEPVTEIIKEPGTLYRHLQRVTVKMPADLHQSIQWEALATELQGHPSVLCIVNRRDDCRTLHALMPEGTIHLSAPHVRATPRRYH